MSLASPASARRTAPDQRHAAGWLRRHAALLLVLLSVPVLFGPTLKLPLERDEGEYAWAADLVQRGGLPYRDTFLQKPPGIVLVYWATFVTVVPALGALSRALSAAGLSWQVKDPDIVGVHLVLVASYVATAYLLYRLGRKAAGRARGGLCAAALLALSLITPPFQATAANTEAFMILPLTGAMLCLWNLREGRRDRTAAAAGLLFGLAIFFKQVAVFHGLQLALSLLFLGAGWGQRLRWLGLFGLCAVLPYAAALACYAACGALGPFLDCVLSHNVEYVTASLEDHGPHLLVRQLAGLGWFNLAVWAAAVVSLAALLVWRRWWLAWFLGGWAVTAALGVSSGGFYRGHYFIQLLPPVCLAAAIGVAALRHLAPAAAVALVALWIWGGDYPFGKDVMALDLERYHSRRFVNAQRLADWLRPQVRPGESLYVFGSEPELYHLTGLRSVTRYVIANPLFGGFASSPARQQEVWRALEDDPPDYVVTANPEVSIPCYGDQSESVLMVGVRERLLPRYRRVAITDAQVEGLYSDEASAGGVARLDLALFVREDRWADFVKKAPPLPRLWLQLSGQ